MDTDAERTDFCGDGKLRPTRGCARELRKAVWKKIFGITGGIRPATALQEAIDKPAHPKSWKKIQDVAKHNTALYEATFDHIPRNAHAKYADQAASIWPTWNASTSNKDGTHGAKTSFMPFDKEFWQPTKQSLAQKLADDSQKAGARVALKGVQGYITFLPIHWTEDENNNLGYHAAPLVENEKAKPQNNPIQIGQADKSEKPT